jgi:hypothetical protein
LISVIVQERRCRRGGKVRVKRKKRRRRRGRVAVWLSNRPTTVPWTWEANSSETVTAPTKSRLRSCCAVCRTTDETTMLKIRTAGTGWSA